MKIIKSKKNYYSKKKECCNMVLEMDVVGVGLVFVLVGGIVLIVCECCRK